MIKETDRKANNVNEDDNIYGKVAEILFKQFVAKPKEKLEWTCFDTTGEEDFQPISVDFVLSKKGDKVRPSVEEIFSNRDDYILFECKCDTWAWRTRHLYWEYQNKNQRGWSEKMECDYIFYAHPEQDEKYGTDEERTYKMVKNTKEVLIVDAKKFAEIKSNIEDIHKLEPRKEMKGINGMWYRRRDTYEQGHEHTNQWLIIDIDFIIEELKTEKVVIWSKEL